MFRNPSVLSARLVACVATLSLTGGAAAQITVPGDFPDPQSAVDAASPGDVIVIQGGTWTPAQFGSKDPALRIDKAITLVGDPPPTFEPIVSGFGQQPPTILLEGPGSGRVAPRTSVA